MGLRGSGDAWKYRQTRPHGLSGIPRNYTPRELKSKPQFTLDELYNSPFRLRRRYSEDGVVSYVEIERRTEPTGIHIFDEYLQFIWQGRSDLQTFADRHGLKLEDIDSLVFVLTGMRGRDFRMAYQVRIADELLRYTDLPIPEVSRRAGFGSANNLYLTFKREFDLAPGYRRLRTRKRGDAGRYKL